MGRIKVFLDSNALFSIAWSGREASRSSILYDLQARGRLTVHISNLVREEVRLNLQGKRRESMALFRGLLKETVVLPDISLDLEESGTGDLPENDRLILGTAVYHGMDYFLTGNSRDFRARYRRKIAGTTVLSPREFLNRSF